MPAVPTVRTGCCKAICIGILTRRREKQGVEREREAGEEWDRSVEEKGERGGKIPTDKKGFVMWTHAMIRLAFSLLTVLGLRLK